MRSLSFLKIIFAFLFINTIFSLAASAQRDVIITQANEEIRCRILDETPTRFIYAYIGPKGDVLRNEIFKNLVRDFSYNKYDSDLPLAKTKKGKNKKSKDITLASKETVGSDSPPKITKKATPEKNTSTESPKEPEKSKKELRKEQKAIEVETKAALKLAKKESKKKAEKEIVTESEITNELEMELDSEPVSESSKELSVKAEAELVAESKVPENPEIAQSDSIKSETEVVAKVTEKPVKEIIQPVESSLTKAIEKKPIVEKEVSDALVEKVILEEKPLVEVPEESLSEIKETKLGTTGEFKNYLKWRVGVKAGIGNILDNNFEASNAYGLYQEKLLKGYTFGADLAFFPLEGFGLGIVYTDFRSSNSNDNLTYINEANGVEMTGSISNKVSRKFVGPAFFLRKGIDFKTFVVLGVSPGMYFYSNKGDYNQANFEYTGKEFGGGATLGLDFLLGNDIIGRDIILSLEAGYNMGKINDINYGDGTGMLTMDNPIIMDRLDFSIGLRFMRFPKYLKK